MGYFQNLEQSPNAVDVQKTPDSKNEVDVTLKLEEQNRNQLTFGAGVSQYEGIFGQLSFQTSNFLGRGESLTLSLQAGSRAEKYQLAFTEPFLFDRNITGGIDVFKRRLQYVNQFTQKSTGGNILFGFPVADFSRLFLTYSYEGTRVSDFNEAFFDPNCFFREGGCREISLDDLEELEPGCAGALASQSVPAGFAADRSGGRAHDQQGRSELRLQYHRQPDLPEYRSAALAFDRFRRPRRQHQLHQAAGRGRGLLPPYQPDVVRLPRAGGVHPAGYGSTQVLPIFERLFLGGEYSIRGFDIRSIGPRDPNTNFVLGGNKSLLFNAEYLITIAGPGAAGSVLRRRSSSEHRAELRLEGKHSSRSFRHRRRSCSTRLPTRDSPCLVRSRPDTRSSSPAKPTPSRCRRVRRFDSSCRY